MIHVLFPLGVRLSTILTACAFVGLAIARRDRLVLVAGWVWLTTFEATFQIVSIALGRLPLGLPGPIFFLGLAATTVALTWQTVRPNWRLLVAAIPFIAIWVGTGFHLNGHQQGMFSLHTRIADFDPTAEFLNDAAKTLWALAYLAPFWSVHRQPRLAAPLPSAKSF